MTPPFAEATRELLYCRTTGRRLAPTTGGTPPTGSPSAVLVIDDGSAVPLVGDAVLGRTPELDRHVVAGRARPVLLADPTHELSRCHALLRVGGWRVEVIDLGSRNGTRVFDGERRTRVMPGLGHRLHDGDQITLGSRSATIHLLRR
ncbi:MAG: FHA domain-containing protein [Actinomycetota bacterium]